MGTVILWLSSHMLIFFALLILVAIFYWLLKNQKKLHLRWKEALLVATIHVAAGWSCMRLLAILEVGGDLEKAANMRLYGAIFVLPLLYYVWGKFTGRDVAFVMDIAAVCVIFGAISGRLNCFVGGCCQGELVFSDGTIRWPIREIELVFYVVFIVLFWSKIRKRKTNGEVYPLYLISYGILRFLCEWVREEYTTQIGQFHLAHIWSLIAIVVGASMLYIVKQKNAV